MNKQQIINIFWKEKGIENPDVLSIEEKRLFVEEMRAFIDGFLACLNWLEREK